MFFLTRPIYPLVISVANAPILGEKYYMCNMLGVPNSTHKFLLNSCISHMFRSNNAIQYKGVGSFLCHNYIRSKLFNDSYISQHQGV